MEYGQLALEMDYYINEAEKQMEAYGGKEKVRFFVASNTAEAAEAFRTHFGSEMVITSDAPLIRGPEDDKDLGNGIWCKSGSQSKQSSCALSNSRGIILDVWLLSQCMHYVYWRGSTALLPLMLNPTLPATWVGPPITEVHSATEFGAPESEDRRKQMFEKWAMSVGALEKELSNEILHPSLHTVERPVFGCPECEAALENYGLTPMTPDTWRSHAELAALDAVSSRKGGTAEKWSSASPEVLEQLLHDLRIGIPEHRVEAALALGASAGAKGNQKVLQALLNALEEGESRGTLIQAIGALAPANNSQALDAILRNLKSGPAAPRALMLLVPPDYCDMKVMMRLGMLVSDTQCSEPVSLVSSALAAFEHFLPNCNPRRMRRLYARLKQNYEDIEPERPAPNLVRLVEVVLPRFVGPDEL